MDEKLFDKWEFDYINSEDISLRIESYRNGEDGPVEIINVSTEELKSHIDKNPVHVSLFCGYELVIFCVKDNEVYIGVFDQVAEYGWKRINNVCLSKSNSKAEPRLSHNQVDNGYCLIQVNEW